MTDDFNNGHVLEQLRRVLGHTQAQAATQINCSTRTIQDWEHGKRTMHAAYLIYYVRAFGAAGIKLLDAAKALVEYRAKKEAEMMRALAESDSDLVLDED